MHPQQVCRGHQVECDDLSLISDDSLEGRAAVLRDLDRLEVAAHVKLMKVKE